MSRRYDRYDRAFIVALLLGELLLIALMLAPLV